MYLSEAPGTMVPETVLFALDLADEAAQPGNGAANTCLQSEIC
jgi:hypothetical protein